MTRDLRTDDREKTASDGGRGVSVAGRPTPMRLTSPTEVRGLLQRLDLKPSRTLGQNFLIDGNILGIMLDAASLAREDAVLEIGPGLGVLTGPMLGRAGRVVAVELDARLHAHLAGTLASPNLVLIHADALDADLPGLLAGGLNKLVSNLPYSVGSRVLVEACQAAARPECMVVTVQLEVADRLGASPGAKDYGLLSIFAQLDYDVRVVKRIARTCFLPPPQVTSAIVKLTRRPSRAVPLRDEALFRRLVKECFSHRRKQMGTIVHDAGALARAGIAPARRPETVSVPEWCALANELER